MAVRREKMAAGRESEFGPPIVSLWNVHVCVFEWYWGVCNIRVRYIVRGQPMAASLPLGAVRAASIQQWLVA